MGLVYGFDTGLSTVDCYTDGMILKARRRSQAHDGFIGLMGLLIVAALIALWTFYYTPLGTGSTTTQDPAADNPQTVSPVEAAAYAKELLEKRNVHLDLETP